MTAKLSAALIRCPVWLMYWQHYLYSMDQDFLRDRAYPLMREAARMMILELREWEDGYLHLPWTSSPEYHGPDETYRWVTHANPDWEHRFGPDATIDLSLLRFMCRTLLQITDILAVEDPDRKTWTHTLEHLVPYEKDRFAVIPCVRIFLLQPRTGISRTSFQSTRFMS